METSTAGPTSSSSATLTITAFADRPRGRLPPMRLIWTGLGRLQQDNDIGSGTNTLTKAQWVVVRVYIEDRSEPGGGHPGGAIEPADIYCFQAWPTGIAIDKKPSKQPITIAAAFRRALAQDSCAFLDGLANGDFPIGTLPSETIMFNGAPVTATVSDCGPLHDGNRQIHPSTSAPCTLPE